MNYGKKEWLIPDMYWPPITSENGSYVSHEAICALNLSGEDCALSISLYFQDREPMTGFSMFCPAGRTNHIRMDQIKNKDGEPVPRGIAYAVLVECSVPAVIQYTRVDTAQPALTIATTMAYPVG